MKRLFGNLRNLNSIKLGALNGFIFGLLFQLFLCALNLDIDYSEYLDSLAPPILSENLSIDSIRIVNWHWSIAIISIVTLFIGIFVGFIIQKSGINKLKSEMLKWQIFGVCFFLPFWTYCSFDCYLKDCWESSGFVCRKSDVLTYLIPDNDLPSFIGLFLLTVTFNLIFSLFLLKFKTYRSELK